MDTVVAKAVAAGVEMTAVQGGTITAGITTVTTITHSGAATDLGNSKEPVGETEASTRIGQAIHLARVTNRTTGAELNEADTRITARCRTTTIKVSFSRNL